MARDFAVKDINIRVWGPKRYLCRSIEKMSNEHPKKRGKIIL
jgi:hypothetical protein